MKPSRPFVHLRRAAFALSLVSTLPTASSQTTVLADTFNRTGNLHGSTPTTTTGGATWSAVGFSGTPWTTDGTRLGVNMWGDFAKLAFTPAAGTTYRISAAVTVTAGSAGDFLGLGLGTGSPLNYLYQAGSPWIAFTNASSIKAWAGPGETASVYSADPAWVANSATLRIDYTTSADGTTATASFYVDDVQVGSTHHYASAPAVNSVFLTTKTYGNGGTFDNFSVVTVVPEPATAALLTSLAVCAAALLRRARREA